MAWVQATNFDLAQRQATKNASGGGTLRIEVKEGHGLPAADSSGKSDPLVKIIFSAKQNLQEATTSVVRQTLNPKFTSGNRFEFNVTQPKDVVMFQVFDADIIGSTTLIAHCQTEIGSDTELGESGTAKLFLHSPSEQHPDALTGPNGAGTLTIEFWYTYDFLANMLASKDLVTKQEDVESFNFFKFKRAMSRISYHSYYLCVPYYYWMDTCLWVRPFESAFWLLFWYCSVFVFENVLSAFFPGIMLVAFLRTRLQRARCGLDGPVEEEGASGLEAQQAMLTVCQVNINWMCDLLDSWYNIYLWRRQDMALTLTKFFAVWTFAVLFVPFFPPFRYWFFLFMFYMYVIYPITLYVPNMMHYQSVLLKRAQDTFTSAVNQKTLEKVVYPYLPEYVQKVLPKSTDSLLEERIKSELPPIPEDDMAFDDWKRLHEDREQKRLVAELKQRIHEGGVSLLSKGLAESGLKPGRLTVTVLSATGLPVADKDGGSDPYVTVRCGRQYYKTMVQKNTLNPIWDATFNFKEITYMSGFLSFEVLDSDGALRASQSLGVAHVALEGLRRDKVIEYNLNLECGSGVLTVRVESKGDIWPSEEEAQVIEKYNRLREPIKQAALKEKPNSSRLGTLVVTVCHGSGKLKICDNHSSDPFCKFTIRGQHPTVTKKTEVKKSTLVPVWNETFEFTSVSSSMGLDIQVFDDDAFTPDDPMGDGYIKDFNFLFEGEPQTVTVKLMERNQHHGNIVLKLLAKDFGRVATLDPPTRATTSAVPIEIGHTRPQSLTPRNPTPPAQSPPPAASPVTMMGSSTSLPPKPPVVTPRGGVKGGPGKLTVWVRSARNLIPLPSSPDNPQPFVKVRLNQPGQSGQKFKTAPAAPGTMNPVWNTNFTFHDLPSDFLQNHQLAIEVWDQKVQRVMAASTLGLELLAQHDQLEKWVEVFRDENKAGEVRLILVPLTQ